MDEDDDCSQNTSLSRRSINPNYLPPTHCLTNSYNKLQSSKGGRRNWINGLKFSFVVVLISLLSCCLSVVNLILGFNLVFGFNLKESESGFNLRLGGPILILQEISALFIFFPVAFLLITKIKIKKCTFLLYLASLLVYFFINMRWLIKEGDAKNSWNGPLTNIKAIEKQIEESKYNLYKKIHFDLLKFAGDQGKIPGWLENLHRRDKCCGLYFGAYEWKAIFNNSFIPDSCCVNEFFGCGLGYFNKTHDERIQVFESGCDLTFSSSVLTHSLDRLHTLQQLKWCEEIFLIFLVIVFIFEVNTIVQPREDDVQHLIMTELSTVSKELKNCEETKESKCKREREGMRNMENMEKFEFVDESNSRNRQQKEPIQIQRLTAF